MGYPTYGFTIEKLILQSGRIAKEKGWDENDVPFPETIALFHSEASEALEEYRTGHGLDEIYYNSDKPDKPEGIPIEVADIMIRIGHWASRHNIDLETALRTKLAYNESRPYRHGGLKA